MAASDNGGTVDRLASRLERSQLQRQTMPGGGSVFRGAIASRALKAVGARAMTIDRQIIVGDGFDASRPEDQALYAHEQYHAERGDGRGGGGGENYRDAEEIAARAVERMVLQRSMGGGYEGGYAPGAGSGAPPVGQPASAGGQGTSSGQEPSASAHAKEEEPEPTAERGYKAMRAKGLSHLEVVEQVAHHVMTMIDEADDSRDFAFGDLQRSL